MMKISKYIPALVAALCIFIGTYMHATGSIVGGPQIPKSFGIMKDVLDIIIVLIFPWDGWVFVVPLLVALLVGWRAPLLIALCLSVAIIFSATIIPSAFNVKVITMAHLLGGISFYLPSFSIIGIAICFIHWCLKKFILHIQAGNTRGNSS